MAFCSKCGSEIPEGTGFCPACGAPVGATAVSTSVSDPYDHTAEFTEAEIKDGKTVAMLCWMAGFIGVLIAYIGYKDNGFAMFHAKQCMNVQIAVLFCCSLGMIPCGIGIIGALILAVIMFVQFFSAACGHAKETAILRGMGCFKL